MQLPLIIPFTDMSELHPKGTPDGLASLVTRKENPDIQYIKMQITINTTTSAHAVPITLNFSAPIAGESFIPRVFPIMSVKLIR